jgi:S1-C subfamily serine protease
VVVVEVLSGSPASRSGLKPCDLIEQVGEERVKNPSEVQVAVDQGKVGAPLELKVRRGEQRLEIQLQPAELPRER